MNTLLLDFKNNATKKPAFYQSNDPSQNVLTLMVSNYTDADVIFPSESKIQIGFGKLLSASEADAITVSDSEWVIASGNSQRGSAVILSPKQPIQLGVNASISLSLTVPSVGEKPTSGNLTIVYSGVKEMNDNETVLRFFILEPPSGKPVIPLNAGWLSNMPAVVYVTPDTNDLLPSSLGLFLSNTSESPLADPNANGANPRFLISFPTIPRPSSNDPVPDPGWNAMTYDDLAKDIWMKVIGDGVNEWSLTPAYGSSNEALVWELKPLTPGILGGGQSVEIMIDHIRTVLPPFTTTLHVQYVDIPGYDDGVMTLHMQKSEPAPGILSFYADAPNIGIGESASLSWSTFAINSLELSYSIDGKTVVKSSDNGEIALQENGYKLAIDHPTTYTLTAYSPTGLSVHQQVTVTVNELNVSMNIEPLTIAKGATAQLSWNVTGSDRTTCTLDPGGIVLPLSGSGYSLTVDETTSYTITGYNSKRSPSANAVQQTVTVMPVHIESFGASPITSVDAGTPVQLSWKVDFPSDIKVEPAADLDPPVTTQPLMPVDSRTVRPQHNTTYTLTATGQNGPREAQVPVTVNSVEIVSLSVNPKITKPGEPAVLSWVTNRAVKAELTGQGEVALPAGSITVNPQRDTTYTLTCEGPNGPVSLSETLETKCVKIIDLWGTCVEKDQIKCMWPGASIQVNWKVENAVATMLMKLNKDGTAASLVALESGKFSFNQSYDTQTYRLIAEGPAGPVTKDMKWTYRD